MQKLVKNYHVSSLFCRNYEQRGFKDEGVMGESVPSNANRVNWVKHRKPLDKGMRAFLKPVVQFCVRVALPIQDLIQILKDLYVEVSAEELRKESKKEPSIRQISLLSGLTRKDVARVQRTETDSLGTHWLARAMNRWECEPAFHTKSGRPRALSYRGADSEFEQLITGISTDVDAGTALREMERLGLVSRTKNSVSRKEGFFSVRGDIEKGLTFLGKQIQTVTNAIIENITEQVDPYHHQIRTEYDNIYVKDLPDIRAWIIKQGKSFHKKVREYLIRRDADLTDRPGEQAGARVVFSTFSYTTEPDEGDEEA